MRLGKNDALVMFKHAYDERGKARVTSLLFTLCTLHLLSYIPSLTYGPSIATTLRYYDPHLC